MRNVIVTAAVLFSGGLTVGCASKSGAQAEAEKTRSAILRVLRADARAAKQWHELPPKATPSQIAWALGRYCDDLERLDTSDCPADFRVAFRQHLRAWREAQAATRALPDGFLRGLFLGAVNALLRGEADGGAARLEGGVRQALDRVRTTWEEVEKVGAKYGVAL